MTVYLIDLEAVETRYTAQWKQYLPHQMIAAGLDVHVISGGDVPQATTPGAFLNFAGTNSYKSQQLLEISKLFAAGTVKAGDYFLYTDAWNPTVIQVKYMSELLGIPVKLGGMWHAGSYDPQDFLGRLIGDKPWVRSAEHSMFSCYDYNFFATKFHVEMFADVFGDWTADELMAENDTVKIVGWPMEYLNDILKPYINTAKKDKIIFPHRLAPEKQLDIFNDLAASMPEYEWFVAQDHQLSKHEYHQHLAESKIVFSANLQETLGISVYEGAIVGTYPLVPNRLSYEEMWDTFFKYPSDWTKNWEHYQRNKNRLMEKIHNIMGSNNADLPGTIKNLNGASTENFFNGLKLYQTIIDAQA
jgi:glycosyltransferase involved in cell wall biosynthesis